MLKIEPSSYHKPLSTLSVCVGQRQSAALPIPDFATSMADCGDRDSVVAQWLKRNSEMLARLS